MHDRMETKSLLPLRPSEHDSIEPTALALELERRGEVELGLRAAIDEKTRAEARLLEALRSEREARERAEAESRAKDELVSVLVHDLKNPLGNVLTATRLVLARDDVSADAKRRLERVVSSSVRMQRMIEQLADAAELGTPEGLLVLRDERHDVAHLAEVVVAEARAAHPDREIRLEADGDAACAVDRGRVLQGIRTLVGNALTHGSRDEPVSVSVQGRGRDVAIEVHNEGRPIDETARAALFDRSRRHRTPASEGLGFGVCICARVAEAHGGGLELDSTAEHGTVFRVRLSREA